MKKANKEYINKDKKTKLKETIKALEEALESDSNFILIFGADSKTDKIYQNLMVVKNLNLVQIGNILKNNIYGMVNDLNKDGKKLY